MNQFANDKKEEPTNPEILWRPVHNTNNKVELTYSTITNVPDEIGHESNPEAKVVLALLSEVLVLREEIARLNAVVTQTTLAGPPSGGTTVSVPADENGEPSKCPIGGRQAGFGQPVPELRGEAQQFKAQAQAQAARENS